MLFTNNSNLLLSLLIIITIIILFLTIKFHSSFFFFSFFYFIFSFFFIIFFFFITTRRSSRRIVPSQKAVFPINVKTQLRTLLPAKVQTSTSTSNAPSKLVFDRIMTVAKRLFVTFICILSISFVWSQPTTLEVREFDGALSMCPDALLSSLTSSVTSSSTTLTATLVSTTGSGTGATATLTLGSNSVTGITITVSGSGYQVGDTLTVAASGGLTEALTFVLQWDDFANGELLQAKDTLKLADSILSGASSAIVTDADIVTNGAGHGVTLSLNWDSNEILGINVTSCTRGFHVGDVINITKDSNFVQVTLKREHFVSVPKKSRSFYDYLGSTKSFDSFTYSGYYLPLLKSTKLVSIVSTYTGSMTPSLSSESSALTSTKVSRVFSVNADKSALLTSVRPPMK